MRQFHPRINSTTFEKTETPRERKLAMSSAEPDEERTEAEIETELVVAFEVLNGASKLIWISAELLLLKVMSFGPYDATKDFSSDTTILNLSLDP